MNATKAHTEMPESISERCVELLNQRKRNMAEVMDELMAKAGIEDLEELHRRFLETEHAYIPVPGLHRGKPISLELFKRFAGGTYPILYRHFVRGVADVLNLDREDALDLGFTYVWGKRLSESLRAKLRDEA